MSEIKLETGILLETSNRNTYLYLVNGRPVDFNSWLQLVIIEGIKEFKDHKRQMNQKRPLTTPSEAV